MFQSSHAYALKQLGVNPTPELCYKHARRMVQGDVAGMRSECAEQELQKIDLALKQVFPELSHNDFTPSRELRITYGLSELYAQGMFSGVSAISSGEANEYSGMSGNVLKPVLGALKNINPTGVALMRLAPGDPATLSADQRAQRREDFFQDASITQAQEAKAEVEELGSKSIPGEAVDIAAARNGVTPFKTTPNPGASGG